MAQEITTTPEATMRTRLAYSVTGRGWDYESTVEITGPVPRSPDEERDLLGVIDRVQMELRERGSAERDFRNARDGKG